MWATKQPKQRLLHSASCFRNCIHNTIQLPWKNEKYTSTHSLVTTARKTKNAAFTFIPCAPLWRRRLNDQQTRHPLIAHSLCIITCCIWASVEICYILIKPTQQYPYSLNVSALSAALLFRVIDCKYKWRTQKEVYRYSGWGTSMELEWVEYLARRWQTQHGQMCIT